MNSVPGSDNTPHSQNGIPTTLDNRVITWDGNPAHVLGVLHDLGEYFARTHQFKPLFAHRAVVTHHGKLAISSKKQIPFIIELVTDSMPRDFAAPCPPIEERITQQSGSATSTRRFSALVTDVDNLAIEHKDTIVVQPYLVDLELGRLHQTLLAIIRDPTVAMALADASRGDGLALLAAMRSYATKAKESDKSLVINNYNLSASCNIPVPITLTDLDKWVREYEHAKSFVPSGSRRTDASEIELINLIAFKDESLQKAYELDFRSAPPSNMAEALELLRSILRSRKVYDEIAGGVNSLKVTSPPNDSLSSHAMMAMMIKSQQALLSAINSGALVKPDPKFNTVGKASGGVSHRDLDPVPHPTNGSYVKPERDSNGQLTKWKSGMEPCRLCFKELSQRCDHLFRDCPLRSDIKNKSGNMKRKFDKSKQSAMNATTCLPDVIDSQKLSDLLAEFAVSSASSSSDGDSAAHSACAATMNSTHASTPIHAQASEPTTPIEVSSNTQRCQVTVQTTPCCVRSPKLAPSTSITDRLWSKLVRLTRHDPNKVTNRTIQHVTSKLSTAYHTCTRLTPIKSNFQSAATHALHFRKLTQQLPIAHAPPPRQSTNPIRSCDRRHLEACMIRNSTHQMKSIQHDPHLFNAGIDSCCTNHATPNKSLLNNLRECNDTFTDANGNETKCSLKGDMDVVALNSHAVPTHFTIKDVIYVPSFKHTLLSVDQLWEQQKIKSMFDIHRQLVLEDGTLIKFNARSATARLPFISLLSLNNIPKELHTALISQSSSSLGFHSITASSHLAKMGSNRIGELMHRRLHVGIDKIRAAAHTTVDGPRALASAPQGTCVHCAKAHITRASHPSSLRAPVAEPGVLHVDLIDIAGDAGKFNYAALFVDEFSRYVFIRFLRRKSDVVQAAKEVIAEFNSIVGSRSDENGTPLPRPQFRRFHGDHEGGLESDHFKAYEADKGIHHTFSPPHDHDLNPIAERAVRTIRELTSAIKSHSNAPQWAMPWLLSHAVDVHNSTVGSVGSSPAHESITPHQRLTLKPPRIMDLATIGCRAVVYLPPPQHHKRALSPRGVEGIFLGRSRRNIGSYDVYAGGKIISSSSVLVDEETMPWRAVAEQHCPLLSSASLPTSEGIDAQAESEASVRPNDETDSSRHRHAPPRRLLNLFSGPYEGDSNLRAHLERSGWAVDQIDNDEQLGGGWNDSILNDSCYKKLLDKCRAGLYSGIMLAPPCSTFSISRLFKLADGSPGAPPVRNAAHPDGLPPDQLPSAHAKELKIANLIISRMVEIAIAAYKSSEASIIIENPADRKQQESPAYDEVFKDQGSLFDTSYFKKLQSHVPLKPVTFAYCRLGVNIQKYTTLYYTEDASAVLDKLGGSNYQCNHPWGSHDKIGGERNSDGRYKTAQAAAYPEQLNVILSNAFTAAYLNRPNNVIPQSQPSMPTPSPQHASAPSTDQLTHQIPAQHAATDELPITEPSLQPSMHVAPHPDTLDPSSVNFIRQHPSRVRKTPDRLHIDDTHARTYTSQAANVAEEAVAGLVHAACMSDVQHKSGPLIPISRWNDVPTVPSTATRCAHNRWIDFVPPTNSAPSNPHMQSAFRADSDDAPSTHAEAADDPKWIEAEKGELDNHDRNGSFTVLNSDQLPNGRRLHKLVWVYKIKRDGTYKARLCVQGCTMEKGIDYDQVFSSSLRYTSARSIFALAARMGYYLRSIDLTAAYLQGAFVDGEVIYCKMPPGYEEMDDSGRPKIIRVDKPIYGIPQSGRRLQRPLVQWFKSNGFSPMDDADPCVFIKGNAKDEIVIVGCYVDNLQIASSAPYDEKGDPPKDSLLAEFIKQFSTDWDVVDEGPIDDLLGIEVRRNDDGSITIHQSKYISKMVDRFLPEGIPAHVQRNSLPYSKFFLTNMVEALSPQAEHYPALVQPYQQRIGSLMYCCTATRPDITYAVNQLCKCMQRPTPALMLEADHVLAYLHRSRDVGLTFEKGDTGKLRAFSDASWETHRSVSGWVVFLGRALISWGSKTQKCTALSSAEAELIALSEATKEVVYQRKWFNHVAPDAIDEPTHLCTDNKAARDTSYNPEHFDRMKHVARRHFFVRDMVEDMQITVPLVRTDVNIADFLTKPLTPKVFYRLRAAVMNEHYDNQYKSAKSRATSK